VHCQVYSARGGADVVIQSLKNLVLRLDPTGVIAGQVSDEDQEPVSGLEVFALRINFQPGGRKQVTTSGRTVTDDLGNFRLPNLPAGSYYVSAGGLIHLPMKEVGLKQGPAGGCITVILSILVRPPSTKRKP
jgi:carboxypeptidase family protein